MILFDAKGARAKRPLPLWWDSFLRKTMHLEADEVGAYLLILGAMWSRDSLDLPNDDKMLSRVSRVSTRLWKSRIKDKILPLLDVENGVVFSNRLRKEATYVERQVQQQSSRKKGENSSKPLKNNKTAPSVDTPTDTPTVHPTQQPNNTIVRKNKNIQKNKALMFDEFWDAFDDKRGKPAALRAWEKHNLDEKAEQVIQGALNYAKTRSHDQHFCKQAQGWLNDGRWEDIIKPSQALSAQGSVNNGNQSTASMILEMAEIARGKSNE